eukprot:jgi/Ulvmu1/2999/UM015_0039.1
MDEEDPICPVCYTGVLQPAGDLGGHLVCSVCFAQSQDVVLEEVENYLGDTIGHLRRAAPASEQQAIEVSVIDVQKEAVVYLKCLQRLLQAQEKVIRKWFACTAYEGVLKQIWKLTVLQSGLLDVGKLKAFAKTDYFSEEDLASEASADGSNEHKVGEISGNAANSAKVVYICNKRLPITTTLACHLLTAWELKLPLWASDIQEAARDGSLPYRDAIGICGDILEDHPYARRALRSFRLVSAAGLTAHTQIAAAGINIVLPELNLGAFVHRHCAALGLPGEIAALATHLALSRQVNTREHGVPEGEDRVRLSCAHKLQVFLPILAVCKHVLKVASMFEDGGDHSFNAAALQPWIQAGQRLLELTHLKPQQRHQMAMAQSVDDVLDYIQLDALYECNLPPSLARAQQSLKDYARDIARRDDDHEQKPEMVGFCGDVLAEPENTQAVASQTYLQLLRLIAVETDLETADLDLVALKYFQDLKHDY